MTSPRRDGSPTKQPTTSSSHSPKGGRSSPALKLKMKRGGRMASKVGSGTSRRDKSGKMHNPGARGGY